MMELDLVADNVLGVIQCDEDGDGARWRKSERRRRR